MNYIYLSIYLYINQSIYRFWVCVWPYIYIYNNIYIYNIYVQKEKYINKYIINT